MKKILSILLAGVLMLSGFPILGFAAQITQLEVGEEYAVSISSYGDYHTFSFVPEISGTYTFYSTGDCEPEIAVYDEDYNCLGYGMYGSYDDDNNFRLEYSYLYAGETYYCDVYLPFEGSGDFGIYVDYGDEYGEYECEREIAGTIQEMYNGFYGIFDWEQGHFFYYLPDDVLEELWVGDRYFFTISAETNTIVAVEEIPPYYSSNIGYMSDFEYSEESDLIRCCVCFDSTREWYEIYYYDDQDERDTIIEEFSEYTGMISCHAGDGILFSLEKAEPPIQSITAVYNNGFAELEYGITENTLIFNKTALEYAGENSPLEFVNGQLYRIDLISYDRSGEAQVVLAESLNSTDLVCGSAVRAAVTAEDDARLCFIPEEDGTYQFISSGNYEHHTYLYDMNESKTVYTDCFWGAENAMTECVYYNMKAGNLYIYGIGGYEDNEAAFSVSASVEKVSDGCAPYELIGGISGVSDDEFRMYTEGATYVFPINPDIDVDFEQYRDVIALGEYIVSIDKSNQITEITAMPEYSEYEIGDLTAVRETWGGYQCRILTQEYEMFDFAQSVNVDGTRYYDDEVYSVLADYTGAVLYTVNSYGEIHKIITDINYKQELIGARYEAKTNSFTGLEYAITEETLILNESELMQEDISRILDGNYYDVSVVAVDRYENARAVIIRYNSGNMGELTGYGTYIPALERIDIEWEYTALSEEEGTCYVAMYSGGTLEKIKPFPVNGDTEGFLSFSIDTENAPEYYTVKCFCWNGSMSPYAKAAEFAVELAVEKDKL